MLFKYCWIKLIVLEIFQSSDRIVRTDFLDQDNLVCNEYLVSGTKYNVPDEQLNASSQYDTAKWGRLNTVYVKDEHIGGWEADRNAHPPHYIEVRFNELSIIHAIATQGRNITGDSVTTECYVTKYHVYYRLDTRRWSAVLGGPGQEPMVFQGNNDSNSIRTNKLPWAVQARTVRILVNDSQGHPSMRFDVRGCPVSQGISEPGFVDLVNLSPDCDFEDGFCRWKQNMTTPLIGRLKVVQMSTTQDSITTTGTWTCQDGISTNEREKDIKTSEALVGVAVGVGVLGLSVQIVIGIYVGRRRPFRSSAATTSIKTDLKMALSNEMSIDTVQEYANVLAGKSESVSPDPIYDNNQGVQSTHQNRLIKEERGHAVVSTPKRKLAQDTQEEQIYDHLDTGENVPRLDDETYDHVKK